MAIQLSESDARRLLGDDVVRQAGKQHVKAAMNRWESQYAFTVFVVPMGAPRMTKRDKWKQRRGFKARMAQMKWMLMNENDLP